MSGLLGARSRNRTWKHAISGPQFLAKSLKASSWSWSSSWSSPGWSWWWWQWWSPWHAGHLHSRLVISLKDWSCSWSDHLLYHLHLITIIIRIILIIFLKDQYHEIKGDLSTALPPPQSIEKLILARLGVSREIYVNIDSPILGFPYLNFFGGGPVKKTPCNFDDDDYKNDDFDDGIKWESWWIWW